MPSPVPTPLAAAFGLVPTVLGGVRRLPGKAVQLPILALSTALTSVDAARREYDDLAQRGERLIAKLRGTSFDALEDDVEDRLKGTPLAAPYDAVEDALEDLTERVGTTLKRGTRIAGKRLDDAADTLEDAADAVREQAGSAAKTVAKAGEKAADKAEDTVEEAVEQTAATVTETAQQAAPAAKKAAKKAAATADKAAQSVDKAADTVKDKATEAAEAAADGPADEQPKNAPTPSATQPDNTRIDTAVSAEVERTVEAVAASAGRGAVLAHDELPLPDYDHMTLGSLRGRMRSLNVEQLVQIRDYEKAHADRLPIVTMLDNRIAKLASDASAEQPSGVPSDRPAPGQGDTQGGSKVTPATGGSAQNPPSAGVPTNPSQPRTSGSPDTNPNSEA